jgi:hypothetical protein
MSFEILTLSGKRFNPLKPSVSDISIVGLNFGHSRIKPLSDSKHTASGLEIRRWILSHHYEQTDELLMRI